MERIIKKKPGRPPGFVGSANRDIEYECSKCGAKPGREGIVSKRVSYMKLTKPQKLIRSRTVAWLCVPCAEAEPEFQQEALAGAPGMRDTKMARRDG